MFLTFTLMHIFIISVSRLTMDKRTGTVTCNGVQEGGSVKSFEQAIQQAVRAKPQNKPLQRAQLEEVWVMYSSRYHVPILKAR